MKIATTAAMAMQSRHYASLQIQQSQHLELTINRPQPPSPPATAQTAAATIAGATPSDNSSADETNDPRLLLIKAVVEWITGKPFKLFRSVLPSNTADAAAPASSAGTPSAAPAAADARSSAGFSLVYEFHASRQELEQTDFSAQGAVTTADGRSIQFALDVAMSRSYSEQTDVSVRAGDAVRKDPLVINFENPAARLATARASFDLDNDGKAEQIPVFSGGSAFLALDRNQNGKIDSGAELFGPASGSGFAELAAYDADGNGWIDESDPIFSKLRLWQPGAADSTLSSLADRGVGALFLGRQATAFELRGAQNEDLGSVKSSGVYLAESGRAGTLQEIDLSV